jgi:uncharacterized membrane protein YuzA (DUF378 family)
MSLHKLTFILLIVGGLNWLLEAFGWGVGQYLPYRAEQLLYILVGLSAVWELLAHKKLCRECNPAGTPMSKPM